MKLCVVGLGKLGAPLAAVLASKGHDVTGIDRNAAAIAAINDGRAPVQEPDLQARIAKNAAQTYNWSPEEYRKFVLGEIDRYREVVRLSGAKQVD